MFMKINEDNTKTIFDDIVDVSVTTFLNDVQIEFKSVIPCILIKLRREQWIYLGGKYIQKVNIEQIKEDSDFAMEFIKPIYVPLEEYEMTCGALSTAQGETKDGCISFSLDEEPCADIILKLNLVQKEV